MKRISFLFVVLFFALFTISADRAFWCGEDKGLSAYSDKYVPSSVLLLTYGDKSTQVKVVSSLGQTLEGRELGLTKTALEELGLWGMGDTDITVGLIKGGLTSLEEPKDESESGWYSITLLPVIKGYSLEKYEILTKNGFKIRTEVVDSRFVFTILYIAEYELEETLSRLEKLDILIDKTEETANPYL